MTIIETAEDMEKELEYRFQAGRAAGLKEAAEIVREHDIMQYHDPVDVGAALYSVATVIEQNPLIDKLKDPKVIKEAAEKAFKEQDKILSDYEELEKRRKKGRPLGNYRLPMGFGNYE